MGSPQHSPSLHGQPLTTENLEESQELDSISEVISQVLNLHWRLSLAEVRVDPVDESFALDSFLFI